jgi:hypothetical protein
LRQLFWSFLPFETVWQLLAIHNSSILIGNLERGIVGFPRTWYSNFYFISGHDDL